MGLVNAPANVCGLGWIITVLVGIVLVLMSADRTPWSVGLAVGIGLPSVYFVGYLVGRADERRPSHDRGKP